MTTASAPPPPDTESESQPATVDPEHGADGADAGGAGERGRLRRTALLAALFVFTTLVMYRPVVGELSSHYYANVGDPAFNTWVLLWDLHGLKDPLDLFDANSFWPHQRTLAYSDNLLPLVPLFGFVRLLGGSPVLAMNVVVLGLSVFTQAMAYLLARRLTRRTDVAVFAALAYAFSGYVFMHIGHVQLLTLGMFPLCFFLLFRLLEERATGLAVATGAASAALFTVSPYYGAIYVLCVATIVVGHVVVAARRDWRVLVRPLLVAGGVVGVLLAPVLYPYFKVQDEFAVRELIPGYGFNPEDVLSPGPNTLFYDELREAADKRDAPAEHAFFPGFSTMALAVVGAGAWVVWVSRRRRSAAGDVDAEEADGADDDAAAGTGARADGLPPVRWRELGLLGAAGVVAIAIGIGSEAMGVHMPYYYLHEYAPGFGGLRSTSRLVTPAMLFGAVLASVGLAVVVARLRRPIAGGIVAALCGVLLLELAIDPVPRQELEDTPENLAVYDELAGRPDGAVVELPIVDVATADGAEWAYLEAPRLVFSGRDWHPRFNGYSGYWPPDYIPNLKVLNTFPDPAALALARELDIRYAVLHAAPMHGFVQYDEATAQRMIAQLPPGVTAERYGNSYLIDLEPEGDQAAAAAG